MIHRCNAGLSLIVVCLFCGSSFGQSPPVNAELVGQWDGFAGSYADVWSDGGYAYLGSFGGSFVHIVDLSDPSAPGPAVTYALPPSAQGSAQDVKVGDDLLFVGVEGGGSVGVHIVDVRDPGNPVGLVDIGREVHEPKDEARLSCSERSVTRTSRVWGPGPPNVESNVARVTSSVPFARRLTSPPNGLIC